MPGWIFHPSSLPWRSARPPLVTRAFFTAGKGLWLRVRVCKAAPASSSSTAGSEHVFPIYSLLPGLNPTAPWVSGFWRLALAPRSSWAGAFPLQDRPQSESSADLQKRRRFTYGTPKVCGAGLINRWTLARDVKSSAFRFKPGCNCWGLGDDLSHPLRCLSTPGRRKPCRWCWDGAALAVPSLQLPQTAPVSPLSAALAPL